jgi:hypothetical protein
LRLIVVALDVCGLLLGGWLLVGRLASTARPFLCWLFCRPEQVNYEKDEKALKINAPIELLVGARPRLATF